MDLETELVERLVDEDNREANFRHEMAVSYARFMDHFFELKQRREHFQNVRR